MKCNLHTLSNEMRNVSRNFTIIYKNHLIVQCLQFDCHAICSFNDSGDYS